MNNFSLNSESKSKIRAVAYCRVSTDKDDQVHSLQGQKNFFQEYIERNPQWIMTSIYSDEGITGTSTKKRKAFNQMMADGEKGLFDLILTKEISRFARNTLDSIFYTRKLKELGIGVFFLNDNINTLDPDSELRLTLMSGIAQEESRRTSQRVKWGQKRRMEAGVVFGRSLLGYDIKGGSLAVNEKEAETIRLIFKKYLEEKKGVNTICKELEAEGRLTKNGCKKWHTGSVYKILQNEKLVGDLLQKKTYTPDYLSHSSKPNRGKEDFVFIEGHHEPIIDRATFEAARLEMQRRSVKKKNEQIRYSSRYPFSGKLLCKRCGSAFVRRNRKKNNGLARITWQCGKQVRYGRSNLNKNSCDNDILDDKLVEKLFLDEFKSRISSLGIDHNTIKAQVSQAVSQAVHEITGDSAKIDKELSALANKKEGLIDLYLEGIIDKAELTEITDKYDKKRDELNKRLLLERDKEKSDKDTMPSLYEAIDNLVYSRCFSGAICREFLDSIIIQGKNEAAVLLNI